MLSRRTFLEIAAALRLAAPSGLLRRAARQKKERNWPSSPPFGSTSPIAQHFGDRFLVGYPRKGRWHHPEMDVVSLYVHQKPEGDQSQARAEEFGFQVYPTIREALRCGGDKLAVDAVLLIIEHGDYPRNAKGTGALSALRVLPAGGGGLRAGWARRSGVQRQAPLLRHGQGQEDGGRFQAAGVFPCWRDPPSR